MHNVNDKLVLFVNPDWKTATAEDPTIEHDTFDLNDHNFVQDKYGNEVYELEGNHIINCDVSLNHAQRQVNISPNASFTFKGNASHIITQGNFNLTLETSVDNSNFIRVKAGHLNLKIPQTDSLNLMLEEGTHLTLLPGSTVMFGRYCLQIADNAKMKLAPNIEVDFHLEDSDYSYKIKTFDKSFNFTRENIGKLLNLSKFITQAYDESACEFKVEAEDYSMLRDHNECDKKLLNEFLITNFEFPYSTKKLDNLITGNSLRIYEISDKNTLDMPGVSAEIPSEIVDKIFSYLNPTLNSLIESDFELTGDVLDNL